MDISRLQEIFADQLNYSAGDLFDPKTDFVGYRTPEGDSLLHIAVGRGDMEAAKALIDLGADVNLQGDMGSTPLHEAEGNEEMRNLLIAHGARPGIENEFGIRA